MAARPPIKEARESPGTVTRPESCATTAMANVKANVPQTCLTGCHKPGSTIAPPFAQLMHVIHLVGGNSNRFLTANQGECTHCHKLNQKTGTWKAASSAEK